MAEHVTSRIAVFSPSAPRFDATTHYWHAEFASMIAYLRTAFPNAATEFDVSGLTCAPLRLSVERMLDQPDFVLIWSRVWEAEATRSLATLARELCPHARILVWGDAPLFMPQYFQREPFDAAVIGGDPEIVISDYIQSVVKSESPEHGLCFKTDSGWKKTAPGRVLDPHYWPFPAQDVIPFNDYQTARENRGKPTDDLSFDVSRGCPVGCEWCVDPLKGGRVGRWRPAKDTVAYMLNGAGPYQQFQCHGPIFTGNRTWIEEFVVAIRQTGSVVPFKAVSLVNHLSDERLVSDLASVGMQAIGFGIETLTADSSQRRLTPKVVERRLEQVAELLHRYDVEPKAYTQIGLKGQNRDDVLYTHRVCLDLGFTVRPTGATPFHLLRHMTVDQLDQLDLTRWDRKSFFDEACGLSLSDFYRMIVSPGTFFESVARAA